MDKKVNYTYIDFATDIIDLLEQVEGDNVKIALMLEKAKALKSTYEKRKESAKKQTRSRMSESTIELANDVYALLKVGYKNALTCHELCAEMGKDVSPLIITTAMKKFEDVRKINVKRLVINSKGKEVTKGYVAFFRIDETEVEEITEVTEETEVEEITEVEEVDENNDTENVE